jgi:hypothetical protein
MVESNGEPCTCGNNTAIRGSFCGFFATFCGDFDGAAESADGRAATAPPTENQRASSNVGGPERLFCAAVDRGLKSEG